jgi:hypothetical protein
MLRAIHINSLSICASMIFDVRATSQHLSVGKSDGDRDGWIDYCDRRIGRFDGAAILHASAGNAPAAGRDYKLKQQSM